MVTLFISCENPGDYRGEEEEEEENVPRETIDFVKQDDGRVLFSTNEDGMLGLPDPYYPDRRRGTTQWELGTTCFETAEDFTVRVRKISGNADGGYGVIFSAVDDDNFYAMFINTQSDTGYYMIGKTKNKIFMPFFYWKSSPEINNGPGATNTIQIIYDSDSKCYRVYFNRDTQGDIWFVDKDDPFPVGGRYGYICEVDGEEDFPGTPVEVWYEQAEPEDIGL